MHALRTNNIDALRGIYRNFFRNSSSAGLVELPYGMAKAYFGRRINDLNRRFYLGDTLHRTDYWIEQTGNRFTLDDLAGPDTGNPFGVAIDGILVRAGSPYQHYCAQRISSLLPAGSSAVAEIGGGFGGMAYYLLRNHPNLTYLDFDLPESIALATYYLMRSLPSLTFLLYGEEELSNETMRQVDVVLMPLFELPKLKNKSIHISFSSHAISDLPSESMIEYLEILSRCTDRHFLYMGTEHAAPTLSNLIEENHFNFHVVETVNTDWNRYKYAKAVEVERLYRTGN
jgi:putative sugar O-methyltransferase